MAALARELGVETFPTHTAGQNVIEYGGKPAPLPRHDPADQPAGAPRRGACPAQAQPAGAHGAHRGAVGGGGRGPARRRDRCHLDAQERVHARRAHPPRARHPGRMGRRARGHVAAPHALLHPLGGQPRDALRHRGRRPAGPLRRRLRSGSRCGWPRSWATSVSCSARPVRADRARAGGRGGSRRRRRGPRPPRDRRDRADACRPARPTTRRCPASATS